MDGLSRSLVELDGDILLACIVEKGNVTDYYVRPGVPVPNELRSAELAMQTSLIMSMALKGQDYMGRLKFIHFHMENADGLHFSLGEGKILAVALKPQAVASGVVSLVQARASQLVATTPQDR